MEVCMKNAPERIYNVSNSQLSVARFYGGCAFQGAGYTYFPEDDVLIRNDLLKNKLNIKSDSREKYQQLNSMDLFK